VTTDAIATVAVSILFVLMLVMPCAIGFHNSKKLDDPYPIELEEIAEEPMVAAVPLRELSLAELAADAEVEAMMAQEAARQAHWAALAAAARAARLRADAAVELARETGREFAEAMRAAEGEYFPGVYPADDFPQSGNHGRAA
jgi:hypothetical protein